MFPHGAKLTIQQQTIHITASALQSCVREFKEARQHVDVYSLTLSFYFQHSKQGQIAGAYPPPLQKRWSSPAFHPHFLPISHYSSYPGDFKADVMVSIDEQTWSYICVESIKELTQKTKLEFQTMKRISSTLAYLSGSWVAITTLNRQKNEGSLSRSVSGFLRNAKDTHI